VRALARVAALAGGALVVAGCSGTSTGTATTAPATTAPASTSPVAAPGAPPPGTTVPEVGPGAGDRLVISTFIFRPNPLAVRVGATVTVENGDDIDHSVTSGPENQPDGHFDHTLSGRGSTATISFDQPGTYRVHCAFHPGMEATVQVS
jgi:plastocyanin